MKGYQQQYLAYNGLYGNDTVAGFAKYFALFFNWGNNSNKSVRTLTLVVLVSYSTFNVLLLPC